MEAFFDGWLAVRMQEQHIPGAVVVVVRDGRTIFSKGYGFADIESQKPMQPQSTILRVGSISKLITATAVLQLVDSGMLDLQTDIREYIEPDILKSYPYPITLHQLLTHSAGIGDRFAGQGVRNPADILPLGDYLKTSLTQPVNKPGVMINYSNQGITLAGYAVEKTTGMSFADYVRDNIFQPLGMDRTTFVPTAEDLSDIARGYNWVFERQRIMPLRHWKPYPASSLTATAQDMARFMLAHLNAGNRSYEPEKNGRILSAGVAAKMHSRQFTMHPQMPGMAYGFREFIENNQRLLWHSGHMPGHRTALFLLPKHNLGLFFYCNSDIKIYRPFLTAFLDRFFPGNFDPVPAPSAPVPLVELRRYAGVYRHNWYPRITFGKASVLMGIQGKEIEVAATGAGLLTIGGHPYLAHEPPLFRSRDDGQLAAFLEDENGRTTHLYMGGSEAYMKLSRHETISFNWLLYRVCLALFILGFISQVFLYLRARKKEGHIHSAISARLAFRGSGLLCSLYFIFIIGLYVVTAQGAYKMLEDLPPALMVLLALPIASAILIPVTAAAAIRAWVTGKLSLWEKAHHIEIISAALAFTWFLHHWNILGYRF